MDELISILGKGTATESVASVLKRLGDFAPSVLNIAPDENVRPNHYLTDKSRGVQIQCTPRGEIEVIFLYSSGRDGFSQYQGQLGSGVSFFSGSPQLLSAFGPPIVHKPLRNVVGIGEVGETLRYDYPNYSASFQLKSQGSGLSLVTLMVPWCVPGGSQKSR